MSKESRIRPSEIRAFLLRYAAKRNILVKEYVSDHDHGPLVFYTHLQDGNGDPKKTATAVSTEHHDNALVMAFLAFLDPGMDFLDEKD